MGDVRVNIVVPSEYVVAERIEFVAHHVEGVYCKCWRERVLCKPRRSAGHSVNAAGDVSGDWVEVGVGVDIRVEEVT